jgi:hypothetical protein
MPEKSSKTDNVVNAMATIGRVQSYFTIVISSVLLVAGTSGPVCLVLNGDAAPPRWAFGCSRAAVD